MKSFPTELPSTRLTLSGAVLAAACAAAGASTIEPPAPQRAAEVRAESRTLFAAPVSEVELAARRGGAAVSNSEQTGTLQDTSAVNVTTGANAVRDGSFANSLGLTTVIQNTGANVLIQNTVTVNVQFK